MGDVPAEQGVIFQAGNAGGLPVPPVIGCFMMGAFGLPAVMVVATTWRQIPQYPWLLLVYLASLFPFLVLWVIKRLMSRYALRVFSSGDVEVVFPFKTVRIGRFDLATVAITSNYVHAINARRYWIVLADRAGKTLATFSPSAFTPQSLQAFVAAVLQVNPSVQVTE